MHYELHEIESNQESLEYLYKIPKAERTPEQNLAIDNAEAAIHKAKRLIKEHLLLDKSKGTVFRQEIKRVLGEEYLDLDAKERRRKYAYSTQH